MPPIKKFQREEIIEIAYKIVENEGLNAINARRIAKELGCSVQPIFHNFDTMDLLNEAVRDRIYSKYKEYMDSSQDKEKPYLAKGIAYIKFAKDYPEFFKILFMRKSNLSPEDFALSDEVTKESVLPAGQSVFTLSYEEQKKLHIKAWFLAHGIACLVATNTIDYSEDYIKELLRSTIRQIIAGSKLIEGGKNE